MGRRANGEGTLVRRGDGRWQASGYVLVAGGGRKRVHFYGTTQQAAREKLQAALEQARRNIPVPETSWSVGRYLDYWMRTVVPIKTRPRTAELYESTVRLYISPFIGKKRLDKLSVQDVQELINRLYADGNSERTLHRVRTVLSSALSRAEKEELVYRNVARLIDLPKYERKAITPWTGEQATAFLAACAGHRWEIGYHLLLTYGMRRGEVLGLRWSDIDFEGDIIHVRQQLQRIQGLLQTGPVKTSAGKRDLPLLPNIREMLLRLHEMQTSDPDELVLLSSTGTPVDPKNFVRTFHEIRDRTGLPRITVHHTRHTAATLLKNLGVPVRDVQLILGHSNITTTQEIYQHGDVTGQREALERVAAALTAPRQTSAASGSLEQAASSNRCQEWLSNGSHAIECEEAQAKKNRRSTGVDTAEFLGGPGGARTLDTLLKSLTCHLLVDAPTPVIRSIGEQAKARIIGSVAVRNSCQTVLSNVRQNERTTLQAQHHLALRRSCNAVLMTKLSRASFPLSLLPTTPLLGDQKGGR